MTRHVFKLSSRPHSERTTCGAGQRWSGVTQRGHPPETARGAVGSGPGSRRGHSPDAHSWKGTWGGEEQRACFLTPPLQLGHMYLCSAQRCHL